MKVRLSAFLATLFAVCLLSFAAVPAQAQRAALTRDQDNPDLAPYRASTTYSLLYANAEQAVTTVPAGKRLVIDHASYVSGGASSDQLVYCSLRLSGGGAILQVLPINPPHASVTPGITLQDGSLPIKIYLEAGETLTVSASHSGNSRDLTLYLTGHYVTP